jgi:hypothetical protein
MAVINGHEYPDRPHRVGTTVFSEPGDTPRLVVSGCDDCAWQSEPTEVSSEAHRAGVRHRASRDVVPYAD